MYFTPVLKKKSGEEIKETDRGQFISQSELIKCLPCVKGGGWHGEDMEGSPGEEERPAPPPPPATAFLTVVSFCTTWAFVEMLSLVPSDQTLISRLHTPTSSQLMRECCCSTEHTLCGQGADTTLKCLVHLIHGPLRGRGRAEAGARQSSV